VLRQQLVLLLQLWHQLQHLHLVLHLLQLHLLWLQLQHLQVHQQLLKLWQPKLLVLQHPQASQLQPQPQPQPQQVHPHLHQLLLLLLQLNLQVHLPANQLLLNLQPQQVKVQ